jgi:hypothetical protein
MLRSAGAAQVGRQRRRTVERDKRNPQSTSIDRVQFSAFTGRVQAKRSCGLALACMHGRAAVAVRACMADGEPALAQGVTQISPVQTSAEHLCPVQPAAEKDARTVRGLHEMKESGREKLPLCALQQQAELGQMNTTGAHQ